MKVIKKILIGIGAFVLVILIAAFVIPVVFKDDIKAAIDKEIAKSINADVVFEADNFNLTLFRNFPNITVEVKELGVFNHEPFAGVPLFVIDKIAVDVNLKDVLFGNQLKLNGISLLRPQIDIRVLKDGRANWDITYPASDTTSIEEEPSAFSFEIEHWEVIDGDLSYDDQSIPFALVLKGLNHTGSGNFNEKAFDLNTLSAADSVTVSYDGIEYISNKRANIDAVIEISEDYTKFTFKENTARLNDFSISFDGWFKMNENNYAMDIQYKSPENSFKSILSLVPGIYSKDFDKIETNGDLSFSGFVRGTYSDTQMPAFNVALNVNEAMFKYPDLPTSINNINIDLHIDNKTGVIENTVVDLKKMHLDFGSNPVDARLLIENLKDYRMDGNLKAKLNLSELSTMFPMEGLLMKGNYFIDASAKGIYDSLRKVIPSINASMTLADGFIKSSDFPMPLEDIHFDASISNATGKMSETLISVKDFNMLLDGEKFNADLNLQNLDDYTWDLKANGGVDLDKMTKIFPIEGMTIAGKVKANIQTKGKYSDVEASRYEKLPTQGTASIREFKFHSNDLPYIISLSSADALFDPRKIEVTNTKGTIGRSDFEINGIINNYIGYLFGANETIQGKMNFQSRMLDLNEFMTEAEESAAVDTSSFGVIPVPQNIDFVLQSEISAVKMMDFTLSNASGKIIVKDGVANLDQIKFNLLGGSFLVNGSYNTKDMKHPLYDFGLNIENLSIQQAANSFSLVQTYAPIAGLVNGSFGTDFKISGELGQDLSPVMNTVNASGLIKIVQAALSQSKLVSGVTQLTRLSDASEVTLKDVIMSATIKDGMLSVKPFDVKFGDYKTNISGSTGLDGSINYTLKMNVPAEKLGSQFQAFINQYAGAKGPTDEIPITIALGGTYKDPKTTLISSEQKEQLQEAVTTVAEEKGKQAIDQALTGAKPKDIVGNILGGKKDTTKVSADTTKTDTTKTDLKQETQKVLQNKLQDLLKKKKKNN